MTHDYVGHLTENLLAMSFDIGSQAKRMVTRQFFGTLGIALLKRGDNSQMILNRALGTLVAANRQLADAAHMQQDVLGQRDDRLRSPKAD